MGLVGLKSMCGEGCVPSGGSRKKLFPGLSQLLEAAGIPWLMAPSSTFTSSNGRSCPSYISSL